MRMRTGPPTVSVDVFDTDRPSAVHIAPASSQPRPPASVTVTSFHDFGLTWTWNRYGRNRRTLSTLPAFTSNDAADGHRLPESSDSLSSSSSMNGVSPSCSETVPRNRAVSGGASRSTVTA